MTDDDRALFIVGPARSGTTMMRMLLNRHPAVGLAPETHFFDDLRARRGFRPGTPLDKTRLAAAVAYFLPLETRSYGQHGAAADGAISARALAERARSLGDDADAVFEAYCRIVAERDNSAIWGEKTPRHVFRLAEILQRYPHARALCMLRDPRAVVASYRDWWATQHVQDAPAEAQRRRDSYHPLLAGLLWRAAVNAAFAAAAQFGPERVRLQRYEDVLTVPEESVRGICHWLDLDFEPEMLNVPLINSTHRVFEAGAGLRREPAARWRGALSADEVGLVEWVAGRAMVRAGYRPEGRIGPFRLARSGAVLPLTVGRSFLANWDRIGSLPGHLWQRLRAMIN